ncbi:MAG: hypothetical protein QOD30_660 [Actinomycetota bacterium]|jgi:hypothetical protein|nr:hypothetical protein [Actinomycetota bacterium]
MDLHALGATPDAFAAALARLGPERFAAAPAPGAWSPAEIFTHVRAADAVIAPRVLQVVARPGVALSDFDERKVGELLARAVVPVEDLVVLFRRRREELLALVATLSADERARIGVHETRGIVTVDDICEALVDHEREHLDQLDAAVRALSVAPS